MPNLDETVFCAAHSIDPPSRRTRFLGHSRSFDGAHWRSLTRAVHIADISSVITNPNISTETKPRD